jgi:hypothetical protein
VSGPLPCSSIKHTAPHPRSFPHPPLRKCRGSCVSRDLWCRPPLALCLSVSADASVGVATMGDPRAGVMAKPTAAESAAAAAQRASVPYAHMRNPTVTSDISVRASLSLCLCVCRADAEEEAKRDEIRTERRREIERDVRMTHMGSEQRSKLQKRYRQCHRCMLPISSLSLSLSVCAVCPRPVA